MQTTFTTIVLWVELAFFGLIFLIALPSLTRLLVALLKKDATWPGDKHYAEPKNVTAEHYLNWYLKGDIPLFAGFILSLLGVLAGGGITLLAILNTFGLLDAIKTAKWNMGLISYTVIVLVGLYCAIQALKKLKFVREFFNSAGYLYAKEKKQKKS